MKEEIKPTQHLLNSFRSYRAKTHCSECGQLLPPKMQKPVAKFYLIKELRDGKMIKVQMVGRKTPLIIHRDFFQLKCQKKP